jgi:serine/threonine-protein kinase
MEAAETRPLDAGTMLDDKYRIERLLAVGGMGAVYEGTHTKLRKRVAIKVLNRGLTSPQMIERFHREAITASQIGHEGIAQVTDLGTSTTGESFLVMELLEGEPLSSRLKSAGPMPVEVACELGCAILSPLAAAHAAGIVHRDLKPDNVFLVRQSRGEMVKLLDFGISRAQGQDQEFRLTTTGLVLGTPYYMSPEQARGEAQITPAADLYAFGVMMYEMLIGTVPIKADNYNALIYKVMTGDFAHPRTKRQDLPPQLEAIVLSAMALDPQQRPHSAAQLEQLLLQFCRPNFRDHMIERISSSHVGFKASSPLLPTPHDQHVAAAATVATPPKKKSFVIPLIIAGAAAGAIGAAVVVSKQSQDKPAPVAKTEAPAVVVETKQEPPPKQAEPKQEEPPKTVENVTIRFEVDPANATIVVDGKPIDGDKLEVPKDDKTHEVSITAKGFQTYKEELTFSETQKLVVHLDKIGQKPKPRPPIKKRDPKTERIDTKSPYDQ